MFRTPLEIGMHQYVVLFPGRGRGGIYAPPSDGVTHCFTTIENHKMRVGGCHWSMLLTVCLPRRVLVKVAVIGTMPRAFSLYVRLSLR